MIGAAVTNATTAQTLVATLHARSAGGPLPMSVPSSDAGASQRKIIATLSQIQSCVPTKTTATIVGAVLRRRPFFFAIISRSSRFTWRSFHDGCDGFSLRSRRPNRQSIGSKTTVVGSSRFLRSVRAVTNCCH